MKEVYGHHPTPPVPPAAFQGAESPALLHLPQSLGPLSLWHPGTGSPGPFCSKLPKRKHLDTHPPPDVVAVVTRLAKISSGFSLPQAEGSCKRLWELYPAPQPGVGLLGICAQGTPKQPLGWDCPCGDGWS